MSGVRLLSQALNYVQLQPKKLPCSTVEVSVLETGAKQIQQANLGPRLHAFS